MGGRNGGRPPKVSEDLKLSGTYREDRHENRIDVEIPLETTPPDWLSEVEAEYWGKLHALLDRNGILKETDSIALVTLCKVFNRYMILAKEFKGSGDYVIEHTSDVGATVKKVNPVFTVLQTTERDLLKLLSEFGMTPASRGKIKKELDRGEDPFEKAMNM